MTIAIIVALARNGVIGRSNALPWRLPDDLKRFRALTLHNTVIMGRRTFESLPGPLKDRHCVVISRNPEWALTGDDTEKATSLEEALARARSSEIFIAGGASLYAQALARADRLYVTEVDATVTGDAFFPPYDPKDWRIAAQESHPADARHRYAFRFLVLERCH